MDAGREDGVLDATEGGLDSGLLTTEGGLEGSFSGGGGLVLGFTLGTELRSIPALNPFTLLFFSIFTL